MPKPVLPRFGDVTVRSSGKTGARLDRLALDLKRPHDPFMIKCFAEGSAMVFRGYGAGQR